MLEQISVVIAVKDPAIEQFLLCLTSFAALANAKKLQIVIIKSGKIPVIPAAILENFGEIKIIDAPPEGVYGAYNIGCEHAKGSYTLFFGADDIALPGMDTLMDKVLLVDDSYHMVAAASYMQSTGISQPSRSRRGLIFSNWCHQGIFYQTAYLQQHRYDQAYKIQADHKLNIDIVSKSTNKIHISRTLVSYFSAGGVSTTRPDLKFRSDFPGIVGKAYGKHWGWLVRFKQIAIDLVRGAPEERFRSNNRR